MRQEHQSSIEMIASVAAHLASVRERIVFLGGAVARLLVTDPAAPIARFTADVDIAVGISTRAQYYRLVEELRALGFRERHEEGDPICRFQIAGTVVDVMPTSEDILGFGNEWYVPAIENAMEYTLPNGTQIQLVSAPYFIATKLAAFKNRGRSDYMMSRDIEDIIYVVDGRGELPQEVSNQDDLLRDFLSTEISAMLANEAFLESISSHLYSDAASQARDELVVRRLEDIANRRG